MPSKAAVDHRHLKKSVCHDCTRVRPHTPSMTDDDGKTNTRSLWLVFRDRISALCIEDNDFDAIRSEYTSPTIEPEGGPWENANDHASAVSDISDEMHFNFFVHVVLLCWRLFGHFDMVSLGSNLVSSASLSLTSTPPLPPPSPSPHTRLPCTCVRDF